ncbi:Bax inhibitor-1/YccA family protein [Xylocopilactobacillus apicola]|uniref:Membrane protein n=1 Tax=Xylocopilactobacillus apicola TaxID=2932184 RepID=A0AAU9DF27_9LACO|nr:Bax inhibitor-1/YccA family protein [Xylocopilactobacillus apicola]BDR58515.1 membrane protein [Xylocopilactobacillus apicola]
MQNDSFNNRDGQSVHGTDPINGHVGERDQALSKYYSMVYLIMFGGVAITTFVSWLLAYPLRNAFVNFLSSGGSVAIMLVTFVPLILVFVMGHNANKDAAASVNLVLFMIMSACYGITLSVTLMFSSAGSVVNALGVTALIFLLMSVLGRNTTSDLQRGRRVAFALLLGVIVVSLINAFMGSSMLEWIIDYAVLGIFTWMIASDQQNIKVAYYQLQDSGATDTMMANYATSSAMGLYLDVLNIFIVLLEIFGGGNNRN